jgi:hypothetical protein
MRLVKLARTYGVRAWESRDMERWTRKARRIVAGFEANAIIDPFVPGDGFIPPCQGEGGRESGGVSREDDRGDTSPSGPKSPAAADPASEAYER